MRMKAKYTLNFSVNGDEDTSVLEVKMEQIKGVNIDKFTNVYIPQVYLNGFKFEDYDDIMEGYIDAEYAMEELSELYKKDLKSRYRKEKKQFRLINEKLN